MKNSTSSRAWFLDQIAKSEFFHQKLHEWGLLDVSREIEKAKGEALDWNLDSLGITTTAWNKIIHQGIKPITVFAHPEILMTVKRSVGYYRMLSMVSQKSMNRAGHSTSQFEEGFASPQPAVAEAITKHLNQIISRLIEFDEIIDAHEFDIWRGMAAGTQAQGSWQNTKGAHSEVIVKGLLQRRIRERGVILSESEDGTQMKLKDGREIIFADEPDVAIYKSGKIRAAVEVKGGIDTAGVLEGIGAAVKSLRRARDENPTAIAILLMQEASLTPRARDDLEINRETITHWFTIDEILESTEKRDELFDLLDI